MMRIRGNKREGERRESGRFSFAQESERERESDCARERGSGRERGGGTTVRPPCAAVLAALHRRLTGLEESGSPLAALACVYVTCMLNFWVFR